MKQKAAFIALFLFLITSQTALANDSIYVMASYGQTTYDTGLSSPTGTAKIYDEADSSKILLGYNLMLGFAAEIYYTDLGGTKLTANSGDTVLNDGTLVTIPVDGYKSESVNEAYGINAVYKLGIGFAEIYAKAGVLYWSSEVETSVNGTVTSYASDTGIETLVGAGVQFGVAPFTSIRIDYEQSKVDDDNITTLSAGIVVGF